MTKKATRKKALRSKAAVRKPAAKARKAKRAKAKTAKTRAAKSKSPRKSAAAAAKPAQVTLPSWTTAEITEAFRRFRAANAEPKGELQHINPFTLLVAVEIGRAHV